MAWAVTDGCRRAVSVQPVPSRNRPIRFRAASRPSTVHGSSQASRLGTSLVIATCSAVWIDPGMTPMTWSGSMIESAPALSPDAVYDVEDHGLGTVRVRSKGLAVMADGTAGTVTYDDALVRTDAGWRIARRKVVKPHPG